MNTLDQLFEASDKTAQTLRVINNKFRRKILNYLSAVKSTTVTALYIDLRMEQSVASMHLGELRKAGMVNDVRRGKEKYYSLDRDAVSDLLDCCRKLNNTIIDARKRHSSVK